MMRPAVVAPVAGALLSGCATTSFAPPSVPITYNGDPQGSQTCKEAAAGARVNRDVRGAWKVIDTFMAAYSCSHDAAVNGRQWFDLPAFLSTTGAATALAVGATPVATIGIAGTAASSVFNAGKAYYDPTAKAAIYNQALSALECIRKASVGVASQKIDENKNKKAQLARIISATPGLADAVQPSPAVTVTADEQYFMLITTAVYQVRDILSGRLSTVGTFNAATVADDIKKATEDAKTKQDKADQKANETSQNPAPSAREAALFTVPNNEGLTEALIAQAREDEVIDLELQALQPNLDICVANAKI